MDINAYLERIQYKGDRSPTLETLAGLQTAHLLTIPFENLDIHLGIPIKLDLPRIYRKMVEHNRGGFCYELNGLFGWLLTELGFNLSLIEAKMYNRDKKELGIPFDHLALLIHLDEKRWLVDVGGGRAFMEPLWIDTEGGQSIRPEEFRIVQGDGNYQLQVNDQVEGWVLRYQFSDQPRAYLDFADGCHYHQTSMETPFIKGRLCTWATANGRITLTDDKLIRWQDGEKLVTAVTSDQQFQRLLYTHFGIDLTQYSPKPPI